MKTNKPVMFAVATIIISLNLMNFANLSDKMPEAFLHIFGIISVAAAALCIFFSVRSACGQKEENKERNDVK